MLLALTLGLALQSGAASTLIEDVRTALSVPGGKPWTQTIETGKANFYGVEADFTLRFAEDGRYVSTVSGPLGSTEGYDGKEYWERSLNGRQSVLSFDAEDAEIGLQLVLTNRWLDPLAAKLRVVNQNVIEVRPSGSQVVETIVINPETNLPINAMIHTLARVESVALGDWRRAGSVLLPGVAVIHDNGTVRTYSVESARSSADSDTALFSMGRLQSTAIAYDSSKPPEIECTKTFTGHLLVHPRVDGKDVGWFVVDTGASGMIIDSHCAEDLQLPKIGEMSFSGVGGNVSSCFRTIGRFELGPIVMSGTQFAELDLAELSREFKVKVAGIVGRDCFYGGIVDISLSTPSVSVYDPDKYLIASAQWSPMLFEAGAPVAQARFEGNRIGWYRLDTGAFGTVAFHSAYCAQQGLLRRKGLKDAEVGGIGGNIKARKGRVAWFDLGGVRFDNPQVLFALDDAGTLSDAYLAGNIGQEFLSCFHVVFDYGRSRVAFLPIESIATASKGGH